MKYCACGVREATELVIVKCSDGQHVKLRFCGPCWERERKKQEDNGMMKVIAKTTDGGTS